MKPSKPWGRISELIRIGPISGFRLRTKLLLLALTTLALPWAGCQYAREMETVLRESEQQSLLAVTTTIAGSLKGRQELLFRADSLPAVSSNDARDITPVVLSGAPLIDGRDDEWDADSRNRIRVAGPGGDSLQLLAATHERWLYLALRVRDDKVIYDASLLRPLDPDTHRRPHLAGIRRQTRRPAAVVFRWHRQRNPARPTHRDARVRARGGGGRAAHRGGVAALARWLRARDRHPAVADGPAHRRAHRRSRPARHGALQLRHPRGRQTCAPPAG